MVPWLHQSNIYIKRKLRVWRDQKCISLVSAKPQLPVRAVKLPRLKRGGMGSRAETCVNWKGPIAMVPCLHQGNIYIKMKLRVWREQKCIPIIGAKAHLPVRAVKLPRLKGGGIWPRTETCINWGGLMAMVPCLHQGNIYIKCKLRVWRAQKYIPLVFAKTPLTCAGRETTPSQGSQYGAENGNLRKLVWTYRHGTVFAPRQYLYQKEATGMERAECIPLVGAKTPLTCAACQT